LVTFRKNHKQCKPNKAKVVVKEYWKKKSWEVEKCWESCKFEKEGRDNLWQ
jgi:hypothetical protein